MKLARSARVLIVDDETNIRLMLRTALRSEGYAVAEATNGREALTAIEREVPAVMMLDLSMPVLDGLGVLQELRNVPADRKPRVIVLTAYGSIPTAVKATRMGAVDFLEKPVSPDEVREAVQAALDEPAAGLPPAGGTGETGDGMLAGGYDAVLDRVRKALRVGQFADAETLLMKAADLAHSDAGYFNLLGVLYESRREWKLARKFYGKAIRADRKYEPAQANMRRMYELFMFGASKEPVTLGDELDAWAAGTAGPRG
jgi:DNA-binding response OmpR family regulator